MLCAILGYFLNIRPFYAMIAAVLCMQSTTGASITTGVTRCFGTAIGGVAAIIVLLIIDFTPLMPYSLLYYIIISLWVAPIIYTAVILNHEKSAFISCVVFFSIVLTHYEGNHYWFAVHRMLETIAGIVIAVAINMLIRNPDHKKAETENTENTENTKS